MSVAMEAGNREVGVLLYAHAERLKSAASVINLQSSSVKVTIHYTSFLVVSPQQSV